MPGVACSDVPASDFLISKNKGDSIFFRGVVKDHSIGSLDLRDCEFFDSEKEAADADAKRLADETAARDLAGRQNAADAETKRLAIESAAIDESTRAAGTDSMPATPAATPSLLQTLLLPATLNDKFRAMIRRAGKRCNTITDHVWVTTEHISIMCDRRLRAAFIHEGDGWRLARPGE